MGMNQVYTYIYEHCVKHSMTRVIDELHKKSNCSSFLAKVSEPSLLIASIHSIIVNASLDHDTIKLLLDSVELLGQQFGEQSAEEFSPKKFLNLIHYIKALLVTNIILDEEIAVDEKVDELNKYFPADDDSPQSPAISPFDLNRVNYKRTQFRCYCLFFLASNKEPNDFLTPGQHQRMKGKVIQPAKYLIETVRGRLPETFIEKFCKKPPSARREMTFPNPVVRELLFEMFGALTQPTEDDVLVIINQMSKYILFDPVDILSSQESLDTMYDTNPSDDNWNSPKRQHVRPGVFPNASSRSQAACPDDGKVYAKKRTKKLIIPDGNCLLSRTTPRNIGSPRKRLSPPIVNGWWKDTNYLSKVRYRRSNGFPKESPDAQVVLNYTNVKPGQRVKVPSPRFKNVVVKVADKSNKKVSSSKSSASLGKDSRKRLQTSPSIKLGTRKRPLEAEGKDLKKTSRPWKVTGLNGSFWNVSSHKRKRKLSQQHIRLSSRLSGNKTSVRDSGGRLSLHSKASTGSSTNGFHVDSRNSAKNSLVKNGVIRKEGSSVEHLRGPKNSCHKVDMNLKNKRTPINRAQTTRMSSCTSPKESLVRDTLGIFASPHSKAITSSDKRSRVNSINSAKNSPVKNGWIRKESSAIEDFHSARNSFNKVEMNLKTTRTPIDYSQASKRLCSQVGVENRKSVLNSSPTSRSSLGKVGGETSAIDSLQVVKSICSRLDTTRRKTDEALQAVGTSCGRDEIRATASESSQATKISSNKNETRRKISSESLQHVESSFNKDEWKTSELLQANEVSCSRVNSQRKNTLETLHRASGSYSETKKRRVTLDSLHTAKTSCNMNKFQAKKRRTTLDSLHSAKTSCYSVDTKKRNFCEFKNDGPTTLGGNLFLSRNGKVDMHSWCDPPGLFSTSGTTNSSGGNFLLSRYGKVDTQSRFDSDWVDSSIMSPEDAFQHKPSARLCVKTLFSYKEPDLDLTADDEAHTDISDTSSEATILKKMGDVETHSLKSDSRLVSSCGREIESSTSVVKSGHGCNGTTTNETEGIAVTRIANTTSPFSSTPETRPDDEELLVHTCSNSQRQQTQTSQDKLVDIGTRYKNIRRANCPRRRKRKSPPTGVRIKTLIAQRDSSDFYKILKKSYRKSYRRTCQKKSQSPGSYKSDESVDLDTSTDFSDFSDSELKLSGNVLLSNSQSTEVEKMALMGQSGSEELDYLSNCRRSPAPRNMAKRDVWKDRTTNCGVNPECALVCDCEGVQDVEVSECDSGSTREVPSFRKVQVTDNGRSWPTPDLNKPRTRTHSERRKTMYLRSSKDPEQPQRYVEMGEWLIDSKFRKYHASSRDHLSANGQHRLTKSLPHRRSQRMIGSASTGSSTAVPHLGRFLKAPFIKPCILKINRMNVPHLNKKDGSIKDKK